MSNDRILLVLPVTAYSVKGQVYLEDQACLGLDQWLRNFDYVTLACPTEETDHVPPNNIPISTVQHINRLKFVPLPLAYTPVKFLKNFRSVATLLSRLIAESDYLHFAIGGFWGDWGSLACLIASRQKLPYAVWTDRVESDVMMFQARSHGGVRRVYRTTSAILARHLERHVIKRSAIGLFHGMDCFDAYEKFSSNPHLVQDINFREGSHIDADTLSSRIAGIQDRHLRFVYAGRAHRDKGVFDWIEAFNIVRSRGFDFDATWYGDGPELKEAQNRVKSLGMQAILQFPGPINDHIRMMQELKAFDAFVFCHKTPESPRCLIEALACGLPIVGYKSPYSLHIIRKNGGGLLSEPNSAEKLADSLCFLAVEKDRLQELSLLAAKDGTRFTSEAVFRHRSDLMKTIPSPAQKRT